ncbi:PP2C family protein-serine/threonine phosphatase [Nocardia anaemiae]|uniref:PP2C family protein-serine/threonine phosphatase n=1 Tax=Nocardia anaemiae TaxID=263910 RepID=UPI0007A4FBAB|nr:serine/threonine-protein phosphatase [Nocardia anaemiae]
MTQPETAVERRCPECAARVGVADRFCEACGRELGARRIALPRSDPNAAPTCEGCGGTRYDADGYCGGCGQLRPQPDRFEADLGAVYVMTDRGIAHARNEDAVAAAVVEDGADRPIVTVIAVSDGVSTSDDPQAASGAAARAGVDACLTALAEARSGTAVVLAGLTAASRAVRDIARHDGHAPSCTYVSAIVRGYGGDGVEITVANVGDSRAYWLQGSGIEPIAGGNLPSTRLTVDDSWAQALVDAGAMDEQAAMRDPRAHTLLRWLGADSEDKPWSDRCVKTFHTTGPGVLLLCSDGLWNYISDPTALARMVSGLPREQAARVLVEFALRSGGSDNITVALVPIGPSVDAGVAQ